MYICTKSYEILQKLPPPPTLSPTTINDNDMFIFFMALKLSCEKCPPPTKGQKYVTLNEEIETTKTDGNCKNTITT